jgi:aminoglycoside phosphotransferase (APT) family kinase protein
MVDTPEAREISPSTLTAMVQQIAPAWTVDSVSRAERGFCSVYRLGVSTDDTERELYLKASPDGEAWGIPVEARIQAVLHENTSIPVPEVLGVADDHERLPTPFYLMGALPGEELPYEQVAYMDDEQLERLATETGRYLGALHSVDAVDQFGHVRHDGPTLTGERPSGEPATLTVGDAHDTWPAYLRERVEQALDRHEESRFADLTADLRDWFDASIQTLDGPFESVLGRNDHGLHNLLVESADGSVTGLLDWGYTLAVPPAFDFEFAVYITSGVFLAGLPDVADRRSMVRTAMLSGYRTTAADLADRISPPEPTYEALAMVRLMNDFDHLDVPEESTTRVRDRIRADARTVLDA